MLDQVRLSVAARLISIITQKINLVTYMHDKINARDWHGVADCAMDLRDLEAEELALEKVRKQITLGENNDT